MSTLYVMAPEMFWAWHFRQAKLTRCRPDVRYGQRAAKQQHVLHLMLGVGATVLLCLCYCCRSCCASGIAAICPYKLQLARYESIDPLQRQRGPRGVTVHQKPGEEYQLVGGPVRSNSQGAAAGGGAASGYQPERHGYQYAMSAAQPPEDTGECI